MNWYIIIFFLLAITLYLYTQYIRLKKDSHQEKIEAFQVKANMTLPEKLQTKHDITLSFLSANKAARQMQSSAREYIALMNQPNLAARGVQTQQELLSQYNQSFQDITTFEQQRITEFILELLSQVQYKYPAYYRYLVNWIKKISLAKAQASLEGGMPHTLGNMVVMDSGWFSNPRATTFLHEITHVHQRQVPFEFEDLYTNWGYYSTPMNQVRGMDAVLQLNRNNPDGTSPDWLWRGKTDIMGASASAGYWWIGAVFSSATPSSLGDINLIAVKMEQDSQGNFYYLKQQPTPLNTLSPFLQYFGGSSPNNYHPNEMAAKFAEWYIEDILGIPRHENPDTSSNRHTGYQVYKDYFNKLIETYY